MELAASTTTPTPARHEDAELALLDGAAILAADDIQYDIVPVPEWGGSVRVRGLTSNEWDKIEDSLVKVDGKKQTVSYAQFRAKLAVAGLVDRQGKRLFTKEEHVAALGAKSAAALKRVADKIRELSKVADEDVEELVGNSSSGRSDDSSTI